MPWNTIHNISSEEFAVRIKSWRNSRIYHLFGIEELFFYILEWSLSVKDVKEQYPLLPITATIEIAERLGIKHPAYCKTKEPKVMTTSFLIDVEESGRIVTKARAVKRSINQLNSKRAIEKLEIERTFWTGKGIDWGIVTKSDMPVVLAENIKLLHPFLNLSEHPNITLRIISHIEQFLIDKMACSDYALAELCLTADEQLGLEPATSLSVVKHLIASKRWDIDMGIPISTGMPIKLRNLKQLTTAGRMLA